MSAPIVTGHLDKTPPASYPQGVLMTATIVYSDPDSKAGGTNGSSLVIGVADAEGNISAPLSLPYLVLAPGVDVPGSFKVTAADASGRVWTVKDNGDGTATATALA